MGVNRLRFERSISYPFSAAIEHSETYFHEHTPGVLRVPLQLGPLRVQLKRSVTTGIVVSPDHTDEARLHEALELWIHPLGRLPFPELRALVTVRPHLPPGTHVVLDLSYEPPLGPLGRVLDALAGRRVAAAIGNALLDDLAAHLAARVEKPASVLRADGSA